MSLTSVYCSFLYCLDCDYRDGDANGYEEFAGRYATIDECAEKCMERKLNDPAINSVSFGINSRAGECYCEKGATSVNAHSNFKACFFI